MVRTLLVWFGRFILSSFITFLIIFFSIYGYFLLQVSDVEFEKEGGFTDEDIEVIKQIPGVTFVRRLDHHIMVGIRTYRIQKIVKHEIPEKTGGYNSTQRIGWLVNERIFWIDPFWLNNLCLTHRFNIFTYFALFMVRFH